MIERLLTFIIPIIIGFNTINTYGQNPVDSSLIVNNKTDFFELSLKDLMNIELDVSTGSFLDVDIKESSSTLSIITKEQIESSGARHLSEALEIYIPGFQYLYNKWNGIIWGMRGVAANRNTKFIFLVNGHKMNHESRDGAFSELDLGLLGDIERIEVLRGQAGLSYGSGAITGVVNVVTKDIDKNNNNITSTIETWKGTNYGGKAEVNYNDIVSKDLKLNVSLGYRISEGTDDARIYGKGSWPYPTEKPLIDGTSTPWLKSEIPQNGVPSAGNSWSTPGNFKFGTTVDFKGLKLYTRMTRQVSNRSGFFPKDAWPDFNGIVFFNDSTAPYREIDGILQSPQSLYGTIEGWNAEKRQYLTDNIMVTAEYLFPVKKNELEVKAGFDAVTNRIQREKLPAYSFQSQDEKDFIEETFGEKRYNTDFTYNLKSVNNLQFAIGYQFRLFDIGKDLAGNNAVGENEKDPVVSNVIYTNHALYSEGLFDINHVFSLNFGARYDVHTKTKQHGGFVSPKLALISKINKNNTIKAIFQSSANNGSADSYELNRWHFDSNGNIVENYSYEIPTVTPSEDSKVLPPAPTQEELDELKPERATSFELVSIHEINNKFFISPSVSYTNIKNIFAWDQERFREINGGEYNVLNIDLEGKYVSKTIQLGINHTYQAPINTNENQSTTYTTPSWDHQNAEYNNGEYTPTPKTDANGNIIMETTTLYPVNNSVTNDGNHFLNLATNVSKLFFDIKINEKLTYHTDFRVFWGLKGRTKNHEEFPDFPDLNAHKSPIVKWNSSVHYRFNQKLRASLLVYDILGSVGSIHTLRWQQMAEPNQSDLYSVDLRSFALTLEYIF